MSTFHARMQEFKRLRQDRRNAGEACGDHRGTVKARDAKDFLTRDMDELEYQIAALLYRTFTDVWHGFRHELEFIVADMNGCYDDEIPF